MVEKTSLCTEDFIKNYNENSDLADFLELFPKELHELHDYLPFLPDRIKIGKIENLLAGLHDKKQYVIHIKKIKVSIRTTKLHRIITFNQKAINKNYLKLYIDMNTKL